MVLAKEAHYKSQSVVFSSEIQRPQAMDNNFKSNQWLCSLIAGGDLLTQGWISEAECLMSGVDSAEAC